jgi:hypothetical protein
VLSLFYFAKKLIWCYLFADLCGLCCWQRKCSWTCSWEGVGHQQPFFSTLAGQPIPAAAEQGLTTVAPYLPGLSAPPRCPFSSSAVSALVRWSLQDWTSAVAACPTSAAPSEVLLMWVCSLIFLPSVHGIGSANNSSLIVLHVGVHFWLVLPLNRKFWSVHTAGYSGGGDGGITSGGICVPNCQLATKRHLPGIMPFSMEGSRQQSRGMMMGTNSSRPTARETSFIPRILYTVSVCIPLLDRDGHVTLTFAVLIF